MVARKVQVVDTNVPLAANGKAEQASAACQLACCESLLAITRGRICLALDDAGEIFREYLGNLSLSGQPGVGDLFLRWAHDHQYNLQRCARIPLTPHDARGYEEFPDDEGLASFDPSDRKFAAVARQAAASVLNAVDSDWWDYQRPLSRAGIQVELVCQDQVATWQKNRTQK
jgi:hypothetical protein